MKSSCWFLLFGYWFSVGSVAPPQGQAWRYTLIRAKREPFVRIRAIGGQSSSWFLVFASWLLICVHLRQSAMLTRKSLNKFPDNHQATLLSCLVVARCVKRMVAIIWAPFGVKRYFLVLGRRRMTLCSRKSRSRYVTLPETSLGWLLG